MAIAISIFWITATLLVGPSGDFPLGDDWSYAMAVRTLLDEHRWQLTDFTSMPLGPQVIWGALFCLPGGFSFGALRLSTLVAAWLGTLGTYSLARACGADERLGLLSALTLASTPIYFALSYTFMTDVPFLALAIWGLVFLVRYLRDERTGDAVRALILITAATLVRQLGLAVGTGAAAAIWLRRGRRLTAVVFPAAGVAALVGYHRLLTLTHVPAMYSFQTEQLLRFVAEGPMAMTIRAVKRLGQLLVYLGTFLLPFLIGAELFKGGGPPARRSARRLAFVGVAIAGAALSAAGLQMPLSGNILNDLTLLPIILAGASNRPRAPWWVWTLVTAAGLVSAAALSVFVTTGFFRTWRERAIDRYRSSLVVLLAVSAAVYAAPILLSSLYDRYVLYLLLAALLACVTMLTRGDQRAPAPRLAIALVVIALLATFSVAALHDTFALNRARWTAARATLEAGTLPDALDGGFEVNGWLAATSGAVDADRLTTKPDAAILISLVPFAGYRIVHQYSFRRWLPYEIATVYLLARQ